MPVPVTIGAKPPQHREHRVRGPALAAVAACICAGCVPAGHLARYCAPLPTFDPLAFFAGPTQGRGSLKVILEHRQITLVEGSGSPDGASGIILEQKVHRGDAAARDRTWHLHRIAIGRYEGTLSDASGPVLGETVGNCLHLAFAMKGGLRAQQWLYLEPGGNVAINRMMVTKIGIPVASLDETITRDDSAKDRSR